MYILAMNSKEKLIETTRELLWERGYTATSPKVIQKRSGIGQGSMYHHFTGKSDLALEAIRKNASDMKNNSKEYLSKGSTAQEKIKTFLLRDRNIQRGCRIGGLTQDPSIIGDEEIRIVLQESFEWLQKELSEIIREGQAAGEFNKKINTDELASTISAVVQGGYVLAKASASDEPFYRAINGLISLLKNNNERSL